MSNGTLKDLAIAEVQLTSTSKVKKNARRKYVKKHTVSLINNATLRLKLFELFDLWDTNNNDELDIHEVILGLHICGVQVKETKKICMLMYEISQKNQTKSHLDHLNGKCN